MQNFPLIRLLCLPLFLPPLLDPPTVCFQVGQRLGFPGGIVIKNPPASAGDVSLIPGMGISHRGGKSNPLQYSCLENSMDRGAWWATVLLLLLLSRFSHVRFFATLWTVACLGSSVHGILQARILEWVALPSSRGSSQDRDGTQVSHVVGKFFTI